MNTIIVPATLAATVVQLLLLLMWPTLSAFLLARKLDCFGNYIKGPDSSDPERCHAACNELSE